MSKDGTASSVSLAAFLSVLVAVVSVGGIARSEDASSPIRPCKLEGRSPVRIAVTPTEPARVLRVDLRGRDRRLIGRQWIFVNSGNPNGTLLSNEAFVLNNGAPSVDCFADTEAIVVPGLHVDSGPEVSIDNVYLGKGSVTVSFYAFWQDLLLDRRDQGLTNELFAVQIDDRLSAQVQVTAQPGQIVTVRTDNVGAGHHRLTILELDLNSPNQSYESLPLSTLEFNMPTELGSK